MIQALPAAAAAARPSEIEIVSVEWSETDYYYYYIKNRMIILYHIIILYYIIFSFFFSASGSSTGCSCRFCKLGFIYFRRVFIIFCQLSIRSVFLILHRVNLSVASLNMRFPSPQAKKVLKLYVYLHFFISLLHEILHFSSTMQKFIHFPLFSSCTPSAFLNLLPLSPLSRLSRLSRLPQLLLLPQYSPT